MRTKIVDVHCPATECRFLVSCAVLLDEPNDKLIVPSHEFPTGKEYPFLGIRCKGSGYPVDLDRLRSASDVADPSGHHDEERERE